TTDQNAIADLAFGIADDVHANVVYLNGSAVSTGHRVHGNFELTRQEGEFRVEGRPLADDFAVRTRINGFFRNDPGIFVGGGVTDTVTTGLHGVHLNFSQIGQNLW